MRFPRKLLAELTLSSAHKTLLFLLRNIEVRQSALKGLSRECDGLGQCRVRVDCQADVGRIGPHLNGEADLGNQVARVWSDNRATQ